MEVDLSDFEFSKELSAKKVAEIPGIIEFDLTVLGDNRGWFKENWQREKMVALGLPADFKPVQNNVSFNEKRGVTRGLHEEPWNKFITIAQGKVFGAWVDLRDGPNFGKTYTTTLDPSKAIFIPEGVANSFQTLEDDTIYTYLVDAHWSPDAEYSLMNLADKTVNIDWPIPLNEAEISDKDKSHPGLDAMQPIKLGGKVMITGANGQLGSELAKLFPDAVQVDRDEFDITDWSQYKKYNWQEFDLILNAAVYADVDGAETDEGRRVAWAVNVAAVRNLTKVATEHDITLVHVSSDYVFDGTKEIHDETESYAPLGVYAQTKAASDEVVSVLDKFYILRTSWLIGNGKNFVRTMAGLAEKGVKPKVVNDQIGRLTFADELARSIKHLVDAQAPYGIYNSTGDGPSVAWDEFASEVFELSGKSRDDVTGISTEEYFADAETKIAPRPHFSTLNLDKIKSTGFAPRDWRDSLKEYVANLKKEEKKS